ncbi:MAG TPA: hypothetical protein VJL29_08770 [Thermoguttaceae bacterium]|nr:hypothetical protein [Thermoguttaceae bacterium]
MSEDNKEVASRKIPLPREYPYQGVGGGAWSCLWMGACVVLVGTLQALDSHHSPNAISLLCDVERVLGAFMVMVGLLYFVPVALLTFHRERTGKLRVVLTESRLTVPTVLPSPTDYDIRLDEITRLRVEEWPGKTTRRAAIRIRARGVSLTINSESLGSKDYLIDEIANVLADATGLAVERETHRPWQFSLSGMLWLMTVVAIWLGFYMWTEKTTPPWRHFSSTAIIFLVFSSRMWCWLWRQWWLRRPGCASGE